MRGLIANLLAGRAAPPVAAPAPDPLDAKRAELDDGISQQKAKRLAREASRRNLRLERARPKVEQLRHEIAMRHVAF